ncbi:MAG: retention module-containing protein, partial [Methyloprofundus sp.]|nr:retention module-containing protein [Methyloprofundus sp.]
MATSGIVKSVSGTVTAIAVDGTERILQVGDSVLPDEQVITGAAGVISIDFADGTHMDMGRNSRLTLNDEELGIDSTLEDIEEAVNDVTAMQAAVENGDAFDPNALEVTAAGGAAGNEGSTTVDVVYTGGDVTPDSGFDTIGISRGITPIDSLDAATASTAADKIVDNDSTEFSANDDETSAFSVNNSDSIVDDGTGTPENPDNDPDNNNTGFSVNDVEISEGGLMTFTVTRSGDAEAEQSVRFGTSITGSNNAEVGDFSANSGLLTFAPGVSSQTFTVQTTQDSIYEGTETFTVSLSDNSTGSTIVDGTGIGSIVADGTGTPENPDNDPDNDNTGFSVNDVEISEGGLMTFTVTRSGDAEAEQSVRFGTS